MFRTSSQKFCVPVLRVFTFAVVGFVAFFTTGPSAYAQVTTPPAPAVGNGTAASTVPATAQLNDANLIAYLKSQVVQLTQPIYIWNWFNSNGRDPGWAAAFNSDDSRGYAHAVSMTSHWYQSLCSNNLALNPADCGGTGAYNDFGGYNMYGPGLYGAVDPVVTRGYGGSSGWVLMQMHLPSGFRILDANSFSTTAFTPDVMTDLSALGCDSNTTYELRRLLDIFGSSSSDTCKLEIRRIFKDVLKLDGFYYSYNGTDYAQCHSGTIGQLNSASFQSYPQRRNGAFVLVSSKDLQPSDVKIFSALSAAGDGLEDRTRIQSLFSQYMLEASTPTIKPSTYGTINPDFSTNPNLPIPIVTTLAADPNGVSVGGGALLWGDLEGKPATPNLNAWMASSLYGCQPAAIYTPVSF